MMELTGYRAVHIINPKSGHGNSLQIPDDAVIYRTKKAGDAEIFALNALREEPRTHLFIHGGDGTVNEVVNGVMRSGHNDTAVLSVIPSGTGNDFYKSLPKDGGVSRADVMKYGDRYAVNIINCGFDCSVVIKTDEIKKKLPVGGGLAYILGVAGTFFSRFGEEIDIEIEEEDGTKHYPGPHMLCLAANGRFYGGGFEAAPLSRFDDGLLDIIFVKKVSKARFVSLIGKYKKGKHLDPKTGDVIDAFKEFLTFRRCRSLRIFGMKALCADGEILKTAETEITVIPGALNFYS